MSQIEQIKLYMKEAISFLDGQGIIITDWDLLEDALEEFGEFSVLREIILPKE